MNEKREFTDQHINLVGSLQRQGEGDFREEGSLYTVKQSFKGECFINSALKSIISTEKSISTKLWHQRLGHPSLQAMRMLGVVKRSQSDIVATKYCPICPLAKQSILVFPCSVSRSTRTLELVHLDV